MPQSLNRHLRGRNACFSRFTGALQDLSHSSLRICGFGEKFGEV